MKALIVIVALVAGCASDPDSNTAESGTVVMGVPNSPACKPLECVRPLSAPQECVVVRWECPR